MTMPLPDFETFFGALHGHPPFPWQRRLASAVVTEGAWPSLLDLPTASGKTAAIDIALYALACRPDVHPRRIVLVVDRRVVVDQGAQRARRMQRALVEAPDGPLAAVASRLRACFGGTDSEPPFSVSVLRGGMPRDESWALRPDMPAVVVSTVDQVGSRLLFRGYGVSQSMAPVHAGLLGNDCLYLLDEMQLSTAFAETLQAIACRWRTWHARNGGESLPDRFLVTAMSATPTSTRPDVRKVLTLDAHDRAHPVLARRLTASKAASLRMVRVAGDEDARRDAFAGACTEEITRHVHGGAEVSAVVVNRVATARAVHQRLQRAFAERAEVVLLTGRMRPLDRERLLGRATDPGSLVSRVSVGRVRGKLQVPVIVVATQSIEAGADFDFDALVTECASLDALRQRFGRLDRVGALGTSAATILVRHDQVSERGDPVYGTALAATWKWLEERPGSGSVDFGIDAFPTPAADVIGTLTSPVTHAPVLLPAHIDTWAQTCPRPEPDPDVSLWLHGPDRGVPEVRVVWRADVQEADLQIVASGVGQLGRSAGDVQDEWRARFAAVPASSLEAVSLPLPAVRSWLGGTSEVPVADMEGAASLDAEQDDRRHADKPRRCLLLSSRGTEVIDGDALRPACTVVVPSSYGGIAAGNWDPDASGAVADFGDLAQLVHRGRVVVRLDPTVWVSSGNHPRDAIWRASAVAAGLPRRSSDDGSDTIRADVGEWLDAQVSAEGPLGRAIRDTVLTSRADRPRCRLVDIGGGSVALIGTTRVDPRQYVDIGEERVMDVLTDEDESGSFSGENVTLERHLADVAALAERFARHLGLSDGVAAAVEQAARWHDVGKSDPRFQQLLAGGSLVRVALNDALLAKSRGESRDREARELARIRSGYPTGYRHELLSLAMLEGVTEEAAGAQDDVLVKHLVASHHGWCRPFAPAVDPGEAIDVQAKVGGRMLRANTAHTYARADSGVAERFMALTERYGWWGIAWLEAMLRLADHRASEEIADREKRLHG